MDLQSISLYVVQTHGKRNFFPHFEKSHMEKWQKFKCLRRDAALISETDEGWQSVRMSWHVPSLSWVQCPDWRDLWIRDGVRPTIFSMLPNNVTKILFLANSISLLWQELKLTFLHLQSSLESCFLWIWSPGETVWMPRRWWPSQWRWGRGWRYGCRPGRPRWLTASHPPWTPARRSPHLQRGLSWASTHLNVYKCIYIYIYI